MRFLVLALSIVFAVSLSSCDTNDTKQSAEITIGLAAPITGSLARVGQDMRLAAEMTTALANDSLSEGTPPYRLLIEDTKSTADGAEEAFKKLIAGGVRFVIGPYTSANTKRILPLIDESKVVTIAPASAAEGLAAESEWLFRTSLAVDTLIFSGVHRTHDLLRYSRVASLTNGADRFSKSAREAFIKEIGKISGVTHARQENFSRFEDEALPEIDSQIRSLQSVTPKLNAIFFFGLAPDRYHFILRAYALGLRNVSLIMPLLSTSDIRLAREKEPLATDGILAVHVWAAGSTHPASQAFVKAYQKRYSAVPNDFHARTYAAADLLLRAIEDAGSGNATRQAVRDTLSAMRKVDTIYGAFSFDKNGDANYKPVVGIVRDNDIILLDD